MGKKREITPWTKEPCHNCGNEYQVTRADSWTVDEDKRLLCDSCESYELGYKEGKESIPVDFKTKPSKPFDGAVQGKRALAILSYAAVDDLYEVKVGSADHQRCEMLVTMGLMHSSATGSFCVTNLGANVAMDALARRVKKMG